MSLQPPTLLAIPPVTTITPFTYREGATLLSIIRNLRLWIEDDLIPHMQNDNQGLRDYIESVKVEIENLVNQYKAELDDTKADWDTRYDLLMSSLIELIGELNDQAVAALINNETSLTRGALNSNFIQKNELLINVKDFGAKGNGVTDDLAAVEAAIAFAPEGSTLFFPTGHYYTPSKPRLDDGTGWTHINKRLDMLGQGEVILEHFAFNVVGSVEPVKPFASTGFPGDEVVSLSEGNVSRGDLIQILTAYNMYTPDAGEFQMGSANGLSGSLPLARGSQMIPVVKASGNSVTLGQRLLYDYPITTAGFADPLPGVGNAEWRKITPVKGMTVDNIQFLHKAYGSAGSKGWNIRLTQDFTFRNCRWDLKEEGGSTIVITDSFNFTMDNCSAEHAFSSNDGGGSSWNMILIGAGVTKARVINSRFERGSQIIDVITNDIPQNPGSQNSLTKSEYRSCNDILIQGNYFNGQVHSVTAHPATDGVMFSGNFVHDSGIAFLSRGRNTSIMGNYITTYLQGLGVSAFSHHLSIVGNVIYQTLAPNAKKHGWTGIQISGFGTEVVTLNSLTGVNINGNTITSRSNVYNCVGINLSHSQSILDIQPDSVKINRSDVNIENNTINDCGVRIGSFFAGVRVNRNTIRMVDVDNTFPCISAEYNSASTQIIGNILTSSSGMQIRALGRVSTGSLTRPYNPDNVINKNQIVGIPNTDFVGGGVRVDSTVGESIITELTGNVGGLPANANTSLEVVFPKQFALPPRVILTPLGHSYTCVSLAITTTGFTAQFRASEVVSSANATYVAIGVTV